MQEYLKNLTDEDYKLFSEIEHLREKIMDRNQTIKVIDYGAGNPQENRTKEEMHSGVPKKISSKELCKIGLKNEFAHLIYALVKRHTPLKVLELGTCCGFSAIYISKALKDRAEIHTIEGSEQTALLAQENFANAKCKNVISHIGRFNDVLPKILPAIAPLDFVFIDGHHDKNATLEYFETIKPYLATNALVLFDDISWSEGMCEAWREIQNDKTIKSFKDYQKVGLCFMGEQR
jgi:predicted O-methyltransferase YrrM